MNGNGHNHDLDDDLLSAYIDGELTDSERAAVEARLAKDPDAQHLLHQLRSVSQDVQSLPLKPAPIDLRSQILNRIESAPLARNTAVTSKPDREVRTAPAPFTFQGRRPWIWASLAIAAGLMIMFFNRENDDRGNLVVATAERGRQTEPRDPQPQSSFGWAENKPAATADPTMIAKSESFDASASAGQPMATPPANVAETAGQVAASGVRSDENSGHFAGGPIAPQAAPTLRDAPSDESVLSGKLVVTVPAPAAVPMNRSEIPATAPATPSVMPASPAQVVDGAALKDVNGQAFPPSPSPAPEQMADLRQESATPGALFGGRGGAISGPAKSQPLKQSEPALKPQQPPSNEIPTLVVHVVAKKYALDNKAFDDLLAKNHIQLEPNSTTLAFEQARRAGGAADRSSKVAESERSSRQLSEKPSSGKELEFVEVEAPQESIVSCLTELKQDSANYVGVAIESTVASSESKAKTDLASSDKKLGTDFSFYARGVVPQTQKDAVSDQFYAYNGQAGAAGGEAASVTSELRDNGRVEVSREKRELEQLKEAKTPSATRSAADQLSVDKSTLGRARRISPDDVLQRGLEPLSASGGVKPRDEDVAKRFQAPAELDALAKQNAGNLRVLFVIGEETPAAMSAPASEKSK